MPPNLPSYDPACQTQLKHLYLVILTNGTVSPRVIRPRQVSTDLRISPLRLMRRARQPPDGHRELSLRAPRGPY